MSTRPRSPEVAAYVVAVRSHLDDLATDEVDELTGGLEADLDAALDDVGAGASAPALSDVFGEPADYAAELRAAAGLPPRARSRARRGPITRGRAAYTRADQGLRAARWWTPVREFAVTLRPVWWVLRAWVAFQILRGGFGTGVSLLPGSAVGLVALGLLVVASVEVGRHHGGWVAAMTRSRWVRRLLIAANIVAVAALVPLLASAGRTHYEFVGSGPEVQPGLVLDGVPVFNVFAYDAEGHPLTGVQLYTESGVPLSVLPDGAIKAYDDAHGTTHAVVPWTDAAGRERSNVYPLRERTLDFLADKQQPYPSPTQPSAPLVAVPAVPGAAGTSPSPGASPSASPSPTASTSPRASVAPGRTP